MTKVVRTQVAATLAALVLVAAMLAGAVALHGASVIRIGAVFPIASNAAGLAGPELSGVRIAAQLVNAAGGVGGRRIELVERNLASAGDADAVMQGLKAAGVQLVIGAYASDLSIAASQAADRAGLLYWESGAVADQLTGRGLPMTFRVGASGSNLGDNSAAFAADQLASRLGKPVSALRVAIAVADDAYATSVADAAQATAVSRGMPVVIRRSYSLTQPNWPSVMADLKAAKPDVIILASHIPDGIAFRQAMVSSGLKVGALIGSTMAECDPDFAGELGTAAIGIFASDRPTAGFQPGALSPGAAATYARFAAAWAAVAGATGGNGASDNGSGEYGAPAKGGSGSGSAGASATEYSITVPDANATSEQNEEALSGFTAAWALFHDVLPTASTFDAAAVAAAARAVDLPEGSLPNGAGLKFSTDPARLGQNDRAAAVIWQWQAVRSYQFVWPPTYATGQVAFVPLDQ